MTILYNLASRSRPGQLLATIDNIQAMVVSPNYRILVKVDDDDYSNDLKAISARGVDVAHGLSSSKIDAINRNIPADGWDILVNCSDDMRFTKYGFDIDILANMDPDRFLHFPDNYAGSKLCTMSIMDRVYYQRDGYIYHPAYYSLWCDNEAQEVAKQRGRYKFIDIPFIQHNHCTNGGASKDALYRRNDTYQQDQLIYEQRKAAGFPA